MKHLELGASLYVPATRPDLVEIGNGEKLPGVRSVIFCTEDAIRAEDVPSAISNIAMTVRYLEPASRLRFIRVRNPEVLESLLNVAAIDAIDGFVLPKVEPASLQRYLELLAPFPKLDIMPTIETAVAFDVAELKQIRRQLSASPVRPRVLSIRVGGNDLLQLIGVRRSPKRTIYETGIGPVISQIVSVFKPEGFNLTAPVFEGLNHPEVLREEVERDLDHGLFGKTAVHPVQVPIIEAVYAVTPNELEMARCALQEDSPAVFRMYDTMVEPATHHVWASAIVARAAMYGLCREEAEVAAF